MNTGDACQEKREKKKKEPLKWSVIKIYQIAKTKAGQGLSLSLAMCLLEMAIFQWMPQQLKLKSGTYITKRKVHHQGLCYNYGPSQLNKDFGNISVL